MNREEILHVLEANRARIMSLGARRLGLFGSYARGEARSDSDVDLLVDFQNPTFDRYMDLKYLLEELLGRRVDLVTEAALKPRLRGRVLAETVHAEGL